jgi:hypothetical protein
MNLQSWAVFWTRGIFARDQVSRLWEAVDLLAGTDGGWKVRHVLVLPISEWVAHH